MNIVERHNMNARAVKLIERLANGELLTIRALADVFGADRVYPLMGYPAANMLDLDKLDWSDLVLQGGKFADELRCSGKTAELWDAPGVKPNDPDVNEAGRVFRGGAHGGKTVGLKGSPDWPSDYHSRTFREIPLTRNRAEDWRRHRCDRCGAGWTWTGSQEGLLSCGIWLKPCDCGVGHLVRTFPPGSFQRSKSLTPEADHG